MPARDGDDFSAFAGQEHMFFGLRDPYDLIRQELQQALAQQISDTEVVSIATWGEPKFLTLGRRNEDESKVIVTHFGFCVRARVAVLFAQRSKGELIETALTFLFGDVDKQGSEKLRTHFDLHADADENFDDELFKRRFLAFRALGKPTA